MVIRHTANYINADSNFDIYNVKPVREYGKYHQVISVLMNILQRGCPTSPSCYISEQISQYPEWPIRLYSDQVPDWDNLIKGDDKRGFNPAEKFYYELMPKYLSDFPYIQQITIPEVKIDEIVPDDNGNFVDQQVDFYIPNAKLVIEIDGSQHQDDIQRELDRKRDNFLKYKGISTVRIPVEYITKGTDELENCFNTIKKRFYYFKEQLKYDVVSYTQYKQGNLKNIYRSVAIIRLQIAFLEMCDFGAIDLDSARIILALKNHEVHGYGEVAINDVMNWLKSLSVLAGVLFHMPQIKVLEVDSFEGIEKDASCIEMSVSKLVSQIECTDETVIYVTKSCRQDVDYYMIKQADPIAYSISKDDNDKKKALRYMMENCFHHDDFRRGQEDIIISALNRKDTIGILPTGSGKSLCYQMAVLLQPCISFCVSPIKSLMIDQHLNLIRSGITRTAFISSDLDKNDRKRVEKDYSEGKYLWVFVSPERFQDNSFRDYLSLLSNDGRTYFGYAVIDEVHCLSEWGHTFRVSYLNLIKTIRKYCPGIVLIGLTATASLKVLKNIMIEFGIKSRENVIASAIFTRPELEFEVIRIDSKHKDHLLADYLERNRESHPNLLKGEGEKTRCGIIFTPYVNGPFGCYELAGKLSSFLDADIRWYAGSEPKYWKKEGQEKWDEYVQRTQREFKNNKFSLLCATKAFGMGIDKPNVRYTVHFGIPSSMEALYQEAGRAGRDGKKALCTILYSPDEKLKEGIEQCLSKNISTGSLRTFVKQYRNKYDWQGDTFRQLALLSHELIDIDSEIQKVNDLVMKYYTPGKKVVIGSQNDDEFNELQKSLFHLSTIGAVEDWTVDWKSKSCITEFSENDLEKLCDITEQYIRNYDEDYNVDREKVLFTDSELETIKKVLEEFLTWYEDNILYSRKQALLNVTYACDNYTKASQQEFKDNMEAYFQLDNLTDLLGDIADNPRNVYLWFGIINPEKIRFEKLSNIIMSLNRFLESYRNNVGLNYISGVLNMINDDFQSANGKARLLQAIVVINSFDDEKKGYILEETIKTVKAFMDTRHIAAFSEFFISNYRYKKAVYTICKSLKDDYSLGIVLDYYKNGNGIED